MKKILSLLFAILMSSGASVPMASISYDIQRAVAESSIPSPETSNVMDDLLSVDEFKTNLLNGDYDIDENEDDFDVIQTLEWNMQGIGFGQNVSGSLYLYVFNRSGKGSEVYNFRQARISTYFPQTQEYNRMQLSFVSAYKDNRFIKYRLDVPDNRFFEQNSITERRYGIIGIEIGKYSGGSNWHYRDYSVCHEWIYTGGGENLVVTYHSDYQHLELEVHTGTYMTNSSIHGATAKNVLYYAWFNVPAQYNGVDYSLYSIHADYHRYDFSNVLGCLQDTHGMEFYESLPSSSYAQYKTDSFNYNANTPWESTFDSGNFIFRYMYDEQAYGHNDFDSAVSDETLKHGEFFVHNKDFGYTTLSQNNYSMITYNRGDYNTDLNPGWSNSRNRYFLPVADALTEFRGSDVASKFNTTNATQLTGQSAASVYKDIHYRNYDPEPLNDAEFREWNLLSFGDNHSGWTNWWARFINDTDIEEHNLSNIECIRKISYADRNMSDSDFKAEYLLHDEDIASVKNDLNSGNLNQENTYLFRFDVDYYDSEPILYSKLYSTGDHWFDTWTGGRCGYLATHYIGIVDFDVIDLTFVNGARELLQLPVISSPSNVFPDLTPPPETYPLTEQLTEGCKSNWKKIVSILLLILGIILVLWIIKKIIIYANKKSNKNKK